MTLPKTRIIKRYSNRKLYDTEQSRYITLQQIADLVQEEVDVQIIDNKTLEDLTGVTLAQILLDSEKKNERGLPLSTLTNMLRSSGTLIQKSLEQQVSVIREEAGRTVVGIRKETKRQLKDLKERTNIDDLRSQLKDIVSQAQTNLEDFQTRIEERIRDASEEAAARTQNDPSVNSGPDLDPDSRPRTKQDPTTIQRLDDLEQRVLSLERLVDNLAPSPAPTEDESNP